MSELGFWDMKQNALSQSDCRISKSTMFLEHDISIPLENDVKAWFFACWYKIMKIESRLKNIAVSMFKIGCDYSCHRTLKMAVFQEWIDKISWFLAYWYKFRKAKRCFNNCRVDKVKNGQNCLAHGTLESGVGHNDLMNWADRQWFDELNR